MPDTRPHTSMRQKLLRLGLSAGLLLVVDVGLALLGAGPESGYDDPFVGFEPGHPLFAMQAGDGGGDVYTTAEAKLRFFNRKSFPPSRPLPSVS